MISRLLFSLILMPLALSEPDLCRNPKLESISYIPDKKMWFFTSAGYYWLINETEFPPGPPNDKLPDGFNKGDAAFYLDFKTVCSQKRSSSKKVRTDQVVVVVENNGTGNRLIELDINTMNWSKSEEWSANQIVGRAKIDNPDQEIDAMFTMGKKDNSVIHDEIYVIQKDKFAVVNLTTYCSGGNVITYPSRSMYDYLHYEQGKIFNAVTFKEKLYVFIDSKWFWKFKISLKDTGFGQIMVDDTGTSKSVASDFFKFPAKCPDITVKTSPNPSNESENAVPSDNESTSVSEPCGGRPLSLIVIIAVVFMIVESTNRSP